MIFADVAHVYSLTNIIFTVMGIAGLLGGSLAFAYGRFRVESLKVLRETNEDLTESRKLQAEQIRELEIKLDLKDQQVKNLERQLIELRNLVQGIDAISKLDQKIDKRFAELMARLEDRQ